MNARITGKEPGLIAYWNFDDGTAEDQSGHANSGVLRGGTDRRIGPAGRSPPEQRANPPAENPELVLKKRLETLEDLWRKLSEIYPALEYKGITGHGVDRADG